MNYELLSLIFVFIVLTIIFGIGGIILFYIVKFARNKFKIESKKNIVKLPTQNDNEPAIYQRKTKGESGRELYITFLKDGKTVLINVNFT